MDKIHKSTTLLLAMMMCWTLVACSGNTGTSGNGSVDSNANLTEVDASQTKLSPDEPAWKLDKSSITFDWYINFEWFTSKWGGDVVSDYVTKKTGVSINFITPTGNASDRLNTMIATGQIPDFITLGKYEGAVQKMIKEGMVLPLNKLADQYDPYFFKVADPTKLSWYTQVDGNVYGYPNASSSPADYQKYGQDMTSNQVFVVRKDMYETLGKPEMRTPEGFLNALEAAKKKFPEVDGQPLIPIGLHDFVEDGSGNYSLEEYLQNFLAIPQQKNGKLYDRRSDPTYLKWLKVFRQANEDGLMPTDVFIDKRTQMNEKIKQGRYFAMLYQSSDFAEANQALYQKDPNKVYIAIDGPADDAHETPTLEGNDASGWTLTFISKNVKDKKRAIAFLSYLISEEGNMDLYLGEKGVTYDTIDGQEQFLPEVMQLLNTDRKAFDSKYGGSYKYWMLMDTNMWLKWKPADVEPAKQLADWSRGKTISMTEFEDLDPDPTTKEGIAKAKNDQLWSQTLPKLLMSKSDAEFDQLFTQYMNSLTYREAIEASRQAAYERNVQKLKSSLNQ